MNFECIKEVTSLQKKRIEIEQCRRFDSDKTKVVTLNGEEIGFYVVHFICGRMTLEYYLFKEYQHKGLGTEFVQAVTDFAGEEYSDYSTIYLLIYYNNRASLKVAQNNGYHVGGVDFEFADMISAETPEYHLYSKGNVHYKKDVKSLVKTDVQKI